MITTTGVPKIRIDEVGRALLVSANGVHLGCHTVARALPAEAGRLCVVMPDPSLAADPRLAAGLRPWVPMHYESVRLVTARAGASAPDLGQAPAQVLCDLLDVEVMAPDGDLASTPDGWLFVPPRPDGSARGWWRFRPGRPPELCGRRFPSPDWERPLAEFAETGVAALTVEEIPAGLWVYHSGDARGGPDPADLAYAIVGEPGTVALLVSRPGDRPLSTSQLRRLVEATPEGLRDRMVVIPYGDRPVADGPLGAVVCQAMNRTLRVRTGLPLRLAGRGSQVVAIDADGAPAWTPFAREISWRPHGGARIHSWAAPGERLLAAGPARFLLNERWVVEILEAGLWIRESDRSDGASIVRQLPLEAGYCTVVIGVCDPNQKPPPVRAIRRLVRRLPEQARTRLRLAVPSAAGGWFAAAAAKGCRRTLHGRALSILMPGGALVGWDAYRHVTQRDRGDLPERLSSATSRRQRFEPAPRGDANDLSRLLGFVDEIRQTPAWDEMSAPAPATRPEVVARVPATASAPPRVDALDAALAGGQRRPASPPSGVAVPLAHPEGRTVSSSGQVDDVRAEPEPDVR